VGLKRLAIAPFLVIALALSAAFPPAGHVRAQVSESKPFFFLQFSDPQFGMFTANKDFTQETVNFEMAVATANRLKPAFVVITGDLVNKAGDPAQIAEYKRIAAGLNRSIPLYSVPGNHDVENEPTPETVAAYVKEIGPDHYSFRSGSLAGVVLNSSVIHSPAKTASLLDQQAAWLRQELKTLRASGARHLVVFQHHPWFLNQADEADEYFNIPRERRLVYLELFKQSGVSALVSGHYHRNSIAKVGDIDMITTGPVGKPQGEGSLSGIRVFIVRDGGLTHRFYSLGELPNAIDLTVGGREGTASPRLR
jgi:3',5'-cyclic AMP phosphodiesterase CpdA